MIVRPSQQGYREYLMSCLEDRIRLFHTAWTHHIAPIITRPHGSVTANPSIAQIRDLYSKVLGFDHWHDMLGSLRDDDSPDDARFGYLDMNLDLGTHLDCQFMESIQAQRLRLYELLQTPPGHPQGFFSVYQGDHGPVETTILLLHRIPSSLLHTHLPSLFTLDKRWAMISSPADERPHVMLKLPSDGEFTMTHVLETCQVPAAVFASRQYLSPLIAQRFRKKELTLADTRRNLTAASTWTVSQHLDYLASIMVTPYPRDTIHQTIQQFIYFMVNWMINESPNGQIQLSFARLAEATSLSNYHIDNLSNGRNGFDINTLCVAVTPSLFLKADEENRFKQIAKRLVYGADVTGEEFMEYEKLFHKAVRLSRPARGLMLTALSDHQPLLMEDNLHNPQSDITFFDHQDVLSAAEWFSRHLHVDGMRHVVEELEHIPFGGAVFTYLPNASELSEADIESLQYLMESCDKRRLQMIFLSEDLTQLPGVTEYCEAAEIIEDNNSMKVKKV